MVRICSYDYPSTFFPDLFIILLLCGCNCFLNLFRAMRILIADLNI